MDKFVYTNKCEKKLKLNGTIHCATQCPSGLSHIARDPYHCEKNLTSKRSDDFGNSQNTEKQNFRDLV